MKIRMATLLLCLLFIFTGCNSKDNGMIPESNGILEENSPPEMPNDNFMPGVPGGVDIGGDNFGGADLGGSDMGVEDDSSYGEKIENTGAYDGYFDNDSNDIVVEYISGTKNAYTLEGKTLTFTEISEETVYSISGTFKGNIVIDVGDAYKFDLELCGFSQVCDSVNPITVVSGDEVALKAKKDTKNYVYDMRAAIDEADETLLSGAVHSEVDLEIGGKGELTVVSENNNGIHSKDDLQIKSLTLFVACIDNALKGNDGVEVEGGNTTLIASGGDCIKTVKSDLSQKGNQRGNVTIIGGTHTLYAACDGIDAAHNVDIDGSTTALNIYTDKYSNYSKEVSVSSSDTNYIRFTIKGYYYSVKYYNSDSDYVWVNAEYHSSVSGGRSNYYYYSYPKIAGYAKQQFFIYEEESQLGQDDEYMVKSDYLTPNLDSDTFALSSRGNQISYSWTNYTTKIQEGGFGGHGGPGGPGGMGGGNTDKGEYSTKGIKAQNEIIITGGTVNVKSYDDAFHANNDGELENGVTALGNITIRGGNVIVYSNDDGLHADGMLSVLDGNVKVKNSYEGIEGAQINISGGSVSVIARDDGINATDSSGVAVTISGGRVYVYCTGDGIDSNSRSSYQGILFSGGNTVVISNSNGNSAIDSEQGYEYTGGAVIAIMPRGGMSSEATRCRDFSSVGNLSQSSLSAGDYLTVEFGSIAATLKMPTSISSALLIVLGDSSPTIDTDSSNSIALDENGVAWN